MYEPKVPDMDPRQDEEAWVVHHQGQVLLAQLRCPATSPAILPPRVFLLKEMMPDP